MASGQPNLLRCVVGRVTNLFCDIHKSDNNPYDPSVGSDVDVDMLPLKEY
jgi:hypothetical protein